MINYGIGHEVPIISFHIKRGNVQSFSQDMPVNSDELLDIDIRVVTCNSIHRVPLDASNKDLRSDYVEGTVFRDNLSNIYVRQYPEYFEGADRDIDWVVRKGRETIHVRSYHDMRYILGFLLRWIHRLSRDKEGIYDSSCWKLDYIRMLYLRIVKQYKDLTGNKIGCRKLSFERRIKFQSIPLRFAVYIKSRV